MRLGLVNGDGVALPSLPALGGVYCGVAALCVLTPVRGEAMTCGEGGVVAKE